MSCFCLNERLRPFLIVAGLFFASLKGWGAGPSTLPALYQDNGPLARGAGNGATFALLLEEDRPLWGWSLVYAPTARAELWTPDLEGRPERLATLLRDGFRLHRVWARPIRWGGSQGLFEGSFRSTGPFTRVNQEGEAIHAYPFSDWYLGFGYGYRWASGAEVAWLVRWVRSKETLPDGTPQYGTGWVHELSALLPLGREMRLGVRLRGLSRGISSPPGERPRKPHSELGIGVLRRWQLGAVWGLQALGELRAPAERGPAFSLGGTLSYHDRMGVAFGYQRATVPWAGWRVTAEGLQEPVSDRLWRAEGPTLGIWARLYSWQVAAAVAPVFRPLAGAQEEVRLRSPRWTWSWSVGRKL
ncbi:MAG: hypothetical protein KatS3mg115_2003 [Candidatus Poribacteria bacterium]|nr:MAG: hypothetical protein KatS3mg115_2003 [Candidatus Poribacteria bacterium]